MAKAKTKAKNPVKFDFTGPETRTAKVEVGEFDPFTITFDVPDGESKLEAGINAAEKIAIRVLNSKKKGKEAEKEAENEAAKEASDDSDDAKERRGDLIIRYIMLHLKAWSLKPKISEESLGALAKANVEAVFGIYLVIKRADSDSKN